jgi:hypothetical protein
VLSLSKISVDKVKYLITEKYGNMGQLKPGATYIYEHADGVTYAREAGAHPGDRIAIGWTYDRLEKDARAQRVALWDQIHHAAKTNPALQEAIERVIVIYELQRGEDPPMWHPV